MSAYPIIAEASRSALQDQAKAGLPLLLPWTRQEISLGTGLNSTLLHTERPWAIAPAFDFGKTGLEGLYYEGSVEGQARYRHAESSSHLSQTEHMSGSVGATVGCPILSGNVTGSYDKLVKSTADSHKISQTAFYRAGSIGFIHQPPLSTKAKQSLLRGEGKKGFETMHGDYYVAGLILGGESGAFLSVDTDSTTESERKSLTVTVKLLFIKKSHTEQTVSTSYTENLRFTFAGFDTLDGHSYTQTPSDRSSLSKTQSACTLFLGKSEELSDRVDHTLKTLELIDGKQLPMSACHSICQSGAVVQLLLMPYTRLRDYQATMVRKTRQRR